ncbi:MAG: putative response regulatory protein [Firmicutes bacterium ADurb.Bin182]|nr:MAG: putative response regulatory protein [Firmicutes bacterium ADurb.Bin182]
MYKVVIIDDEEIIVQGLMRVIDWERFNCRVVAAAYDADSGTQAILRHMPDILLTDIKMPGMNGLAMLAGVKSEFPNMQVTVLTGYRDFSFAQEAIRLGVSRFLLKPSKMDEIEEALNVMIEKLDKIYHPPKESKAGEQTEDDDGHDQDVAASFIVRQALSFIQEHYPEKLSLQETANNCYVSQWHLSKLLNKHTGQSFYDILNGCRIKEAKRLLKDPSLRITDICEIVGYTDSAHFARIFKKLTGMSANEYRNTKLRE